MDSRRVSIQRVSIDRSEYQKQQMHDLIVQQEQVLQKGVELQRENDRHSQLEDAYITATIKAMENFRTFYYRNIHRPRQEIPIITKPSSWWKSFKTKCKSHLCCCRCG